jgi:hypothetical protein
MNKIKGIEKTTSVCTTWQPSDIAFITSLIWSAQNLTMVFYSQSRHGVNEWPDTSKDFFEISATFKNVLNLKIDFSDSGPHQITGFDILDISSDGLEKINFQIVDYETGMINFSCEEIEIDRISTNNRVIF